MNGAKLRLRLMPQTRVSHKVFLARQSYQRRISAIVLKRISHH